MATHEDDPVGDMEKQLPIPPPQSSPCPTTADDDEAADLEGESAAANDSTTNTKTMMTDTLLLAIWYIILITFSTLVFPFGVVYVIGSICLTGAINSPNACFSCKRGRKASKPKKEKGIYKKMRDFESTKDKIQRLNIVATTRAGCLALAWLVVNLCVPSLTRMSLFGCPVWTWSLLAVVILLGYTFTKLGTNILLLVISTFNDGFTKQPNLDYFLRGLEDSLASLLHFTSILLLWLLYFRTDHGLHPSEKFDKFATWTFVSVLVGSVLWVVKSAVLLEWKANAVYKRFKARILTVGFQLYFLSIIINKLCVPELLPWRSCEKKQDEPTESPMGIEGKTINMLDNDNDNDNDNNNHHAAKDRKNLCIQDYMLSKSVATQQIESVARFVTGLTRVTLRENDGIPEIVAKCQGKIQTNHENTITIEALGGIFKLSTEDAELLLQELKREEMSEDITYNAFEKWIVDAHKNCLSVGYTLIDAFAVVSVLNRVIISFIFVAVILLWLLVTDLATTTALVMIASQFLALSFVFGDTCKTFFQGIIFSFVTHPYDVGDRCIIDDVELEVKRSGIWTTKFVKIGTKEKVLHPNTILSTKVITNLEGEPDPSDMIELILDSSTTKPKILKLKEDLKSFFENTERHGLYEKNVRMIVKEIGSNIKLSICFKHVMNVKDVSHSQCFKRKYRQRSELLIDIKQFLEDHQIKFATP